MLSHVLARCHCSTSIPTNRRSAQSKYQTVWEVSYQMVVLSYFLAGCHCCSQHLLSGGVPEASTRPSWKCHLIRWLCRSIFLPAPQYLLSEGVAEESTRPSWKRHLIRWWWCPIFLPDVTAAPSIFSAEEWHSKFYSIPSWEVSTD